MSSIYSQFVFPNKLVSPINGYECKHITKQNIKQFGFNSKEDLLNQFPDFPLFSEEYLNNTAIGYKKARKTQSLIKQNKKKEAVNLYLKNPSHCTQCDAILEFKQRNNKFCDSSCAAIYNNHKRPKKIKTQKIAIKKQNKISKPIIQKNKLSIIKKKIFCVICNNEISSVKQTCSRECYKKLQSNKQSARLKDNDYRKKYYIRKKRSFMEESFDLWLSNNYSGKYYDEIHFYNEETKKHGWADFVFPKEKIIIELDGTHHRNRVHLDRIRDEYLSRVRGYTVCRITIQEYYSKCKISLVKELLGIK